jgi:hypothetical protein
LVVVVVGEHCAHSIGNMIAEPQVEKPHTLHEGVKYPLTADSRNRLQPVESDRADRLTVTVGHELRHTDRDSPRHAPAVYDPDNRELGRPDHGATVMIGPGHQR